MTDWPANADDAPEGVPDDSTAGSSTSPDAEPTPSPEGDGTPPGDGSDAAAGAATDTTPDGTDGQPEPPPYRFNKVIGQRDAATKARDAAVAELQSIRAENAAFKRMFAAAAGVPSTEPGAPQPLSEKEKALADRMFSLLDRAYPGLSKAIQLAARADDLTAAADRMSTLDQRIAADNERYATESEGLLESAFVKISLGEGQTAKDVDPEALREFKQDFITWVASNEARSNRFEAGYGRALVDEFTARQEGLYVAPRRRQQASLIRKQAAKAKGLPEGGSSAAPVSSGPKKPDLSDIDAVADHSWEVAQPAMGNG